MHSNRTFKLLLIIVAMMMLVAQFLSGHRAIAYSSGPPTLRSGAPGEVTCAICHNSFSLNSGPGTVSITGLPPNYSPNQEVLLTLTIAQANRDLFGFELTAIDDDGRQAGTIVVTDDLRTQLLVDAVDGKLRQYLSHTLPGTVPASVDQGRWSFKWRAPAAGVGRVTFYVAGNAANGNGGSSGDYIYTASASVLPQSVAAPGYEADVAPRPNGSNNGTVTIADWVQVGRFAAGLDAAAGGGEFQRADCAPIATLGNGVISIADWVQAGRYAAGLDLVVQAGGPVGPAQFRLSQWARGDVFGIPAEANATGLRIRRESGQRWRGLVSYVVELDALGGENALGSSLRFDSMQLRLMRVALGESLAGATLNVNGAQAGRLGFAIALPAGQRLAYGTHQIAVVTFAAAAGGVEDSGSVELSDEPIVREIVDAEARPRSLRL